MFNVRMLYSTCRSAYIIIALYIHDTFHAFLTFTCRWCIYMYVPSSLCCVCFPCLLVRLRGSFVVSASQDCTVKLWGLRGLRKSSASECPLKLAVKFTQLAHDKVLLYKQPAR